MDKERLQYLADEYRLAQVRLSQIRGQLLKAQTSLEISEEVLKDLDDELEKAKAAQDKALAGQWQSLKEFLTKDQDSSSREEVDRLEKKITAKQEELIIYYERKLKVIKKLLGERLTAIIEGYDEKSVLIGGGAASGGSVQRLIDKGEEGKEMADQQAKKKNVNFDKM